MRNQPYHDISALSSLMAVAILLLLIFPLYSQSAASIRTEYHGTKRQVAEHPDRRYRANSLAKVSQDAPLETIGHWANGRGEAVVVGDNAVYFNDGGYLVIADRASDGTPVNPRYFLRPGYILDMELRSDTLYLATGAGGLQILDVGNPDNPVDLGVFDPGVYISKIIVKGSTAYVPQRSFDPFGVSGIRMLDISDPGNLVELGFWQTNPLTFGFLDFVVEGNYLYTAGATSGVGIVDISVPAAPAEVTTISLPGWVSTLAVKDSILYVPYQYSAYGVRVIDVSTPSSPVTVTTLSAPGNPAWNSAAIYGDTLAITAVNGGVSLANISTPSSPQWWITIYNPNNEYGTYQSAALGSILYLATINDLLTLDIQVPSQPAVLSQQTLGGWTKSLAVDGDWLFRVGKDLSIADAGDPGNLQIYPFFNNFGIGGESTVFDVTLDGGIAYCTFGDDGLTAIDVADPTNPAFISHLTAGSTYLWKLVKIGDYLYVIDDNSGGIDIYDVSNPAQMQQAGTIASDAYQVSNAGDSLLAIAESDLLSIYSLNNPAVPQLLGDLSLGYFLSDLAISGQYAYVLKEEGGMRIVDIGDPANPVEVGYLDLGVDDASVIAVAGDFAYVGTWNGKVFMADISTPQSPVDLGSYDTPLVDISDIKIAGDRVYISDSDAGIRILRNTLLSGIEPPAPGSLPATFTLYQNYPNPFNPGTAIAFSLPEASRVTLSVFNIAGEHIQTLARGQHSAGTHRLTWNASGLSSGVYLIRLQAGNQIQTRKALLVK